MIEQIEETRVPHYIKITKTQEGVPMIRFAWYRPLHGLLLAFILIVFAGAFVYLLSQSASLKPEYITMFAIILGLVFLLILFFVLRLILNTTTIELADYAIIVKVRPISRWQSRYIPRDDIQAITLGQTAENSAIQQIILTLNSAETIAIGAEFYTTEETQFVQQYIARHYGITESLGIAEA